MSPATLRLVLLISLAHALVHVYELALPSAEQSIATSFHVGPETTGLLGAVWRVPFGVGALLAGWLADRFGSRRLLIIYLLGCGTTSALAWYCPNLGVLFVTMFAMGSFASIYHPSGLAMISHETSPEVRGRALGWHGILGSFGIAGAPFLASYVFRFESIDWRQYYLTLMLPGIGLALAIRRWLPGRIYHDEQPNASSGGAAAPQQPARLDAFLALVGLGVLYGFLYAAFVQFLPRYLDDIGLKPPDADPRSFRTLLAGIVLSCGAFGQGFAGRLARPHRLGWLLAAILLANAPCFLWMAMAEGRARLWATCLLAFVHFMQQPVYNSLIPRYVPRAKLSVSYGFSNMMCFGVGAIGSGYAGYLLEVLGPHHGEMWTYTTLAAVAAVAGMLALALWKRFPDPPKP